MFINLITVSKLCRNIIYTTTIHISETHNPTMDEILNRIHEKYPTLYDTDFTLYWCYSHDEFFKIRDFLSYYTSLNLMTDHHHCIYLLLNDSCGLEINEAFLLNLDRIEEKEEEVRKRDKYDVQIVDAEEAEEEEEEVEVGRCEPMRDEEILRFARRKESRGYYYTADLRQKFKMIEDAKRDMKGEVISCSHKDIYFLETNTKSESTDLANLFSPPTGKELFKCKSRTKLKQKLNPTLEFFIHNNNNNTSKTTTEQSKTTSPSDPGQCPSTSQIIPMETSTSKKGTTSRKTSLDLYEEAATILGLTCSQTDSCKCIECQCHYFDFEEDIDFPGSDCVMDHNSTCSIQ